MKAKLVGFRRVEMMDEKTGRAINGFSCFITYPTDGVEGVAAEKIFVSDQKASLSGFYPFVDGVVDLEYGPRGRLVSVINDK